MTTSNAAIATREYLAFISYRHADNKQQGRQWATWLHQALETYEVPADLVGKTNSRGEVIPERIYPIFRDEDELPAHADLANSITSALANSRLLVVLCSPNAVASTYVADEIRFFKQLGHSDRIIAAMIDGEPNASWDNAKQAAGVQPETECFPLPLQFTVDEQGELTTQRAEPIAADFRVNLDGKTEQGWTNVEALKQHLKTTTKLTEPQVKAIVSGYQQQQQLMLLKIIAGILGVPLGELTKRDQAYQLEQQRKKAKRLRQWLSGVAVLALLATGAGIYAWQQRVEAVAQRKQADLKTKIAEEQQKIAENREQRLSKYINTMEPVLQSAFSLLFTNRTNIDDFSTVILGAYDNEDTREKLVELLTDMLNKAESMDEEEAELWVGILPKMEKEQLVRLINILSNESKVLEDLEFKYRADEMNLKNGNVRKPFWKIYSEADLKKTLSECKNSILINLHDFNVKNLKEHLISQLKSEVNSEDEAISFISCVNKSTPVERYVAIVRDISKFDKDIWWKISYYDLISADESRSYNVYRVIFGDIMLDFLNKWKGVESKRIYILKRVIENINIDDKKKKLYIDSLARISLEDAGVLYNNLIDFVYKVNEQEAVERYGEFKSVIDGAIIF